MNKESYIRTKLDVTEFQSDDILTGSGPLIEVDPGQTGGGDMSDPPENVILNR